MKNKSYSVDLAMVTRKFYCHCCGDRLLRNSRTVTLKRGDPGYKEHSRIGGVQMIGDVDHTEYDFKCWTCNRIVQKNEQYVIEKIQKKLGKHILSEKEIEKNEQAARATLARKKRIGNIICTAITIAVVAVAFYFCLKAGGFSF